MALQNIVVTGSRGFIHRHQHLFKEMSHYFDRIECLPAGNLSQNRFLDLLIRGFNRKIASVIAPQQATRFWLNSQRFITRSHLTEQKIRQLDYRPDLIFHVFCTFSPFWESFDIPYVMYLDYTMSLAKQNWPAWTPFSGEQAFAAWVDCERLTYEKAQHIFTMGSTTQYSLVRDYGIEPEKITVIGSSGNCEPFDGQKTFGSQQLLFNGSDFERKGGDLVLAAFRQVKDTMPNARLVVIGKKLPFLEEGVINPGVIASREDLKELFLNTDLVVAPARCDPFPTFLMEAMNYGVPCIVSAADGMPEIVEDGVSGIVLAQSTPELIADQIIRLLGDRARLEIMSQAARDQIKNRLNWSTIAKKVANVLSSLTFRQTNTIEFKQSMDLNPWLSKQQ